MIARGNVWVILLQRAACLLWMLLLSGDCIVSAFMVLFCCLCGVECCMLCAYVLLSCCLYALCMCAISLLLVL